MNKKDFILRVLDVVESSRDMAPGLKVLIQNNALDDKTIDTLVSAFRTAAEKTESQQAKQALTQGASMIEDVHAKEAIEKEKDLQDLAELEDMFKNL